MGSSLLTRSQDDETPAVAVVVSGAGEEDRTPLRFLA